MPEKVGGPMQVELSPNAAPATNNADKKPPNGGLRAWLTVTSAFFIVMNTWGVLVSFGTFQSYYVVKLHRKHSDIAWIGSFEIFLLFFLGMPAGRLSDAGYFRLLMLSGAFMTTLGTFMTSICNTYWQFFLAQGVCVGIGNGLLFAPTVAVTSTYFSSKRALAIAITACGSVTGGLIFPSMLRTLLPTIGFGWTMRAIGLIQVVTLAIAVAYMKTRVPPDTSRSWLDLSAFSEAEYSFFAIGSFLTYTGAFFPFFFISTFARDKLGMPFSESLNFLLVLNGVRILGHLLPGYLADRVGAMNVFTATVLLSSISIYTWTAVSSVSGLYVWAAFYSVFFGAIQSLSPPALASLTSNLRKLGTRMGINFGVQSFGGLIGMPVAGALITGSSGAYLVAQMFSASCIAAGAICLAIARECKRRQADGGLWVKL